MSKLNVIVPLLIYVLAAGGCATPAPLPAQAAEYQCPQLPPAPPEAEWPPRETDFLIEVRSFFSDKLPAPTQ